MSDADGGFSATCNRFHLRQEYLPAIDAIADEAVIHTSESGIETNVVDPANAALVEVSLGRGAFTECEPADHSFGVSIPFLRSVLPQENDPLSVEYDPETADFAIDTGPYRYLHATRDLESVRDEPYVPDLDHTFSADLCIDRLRDAIECFDSWTKHVWMGFDPDGGTFWLQSSTTDRRTASGKGKFGIDESDLNSVRQRGRAESHFSLDYLTSIVEAVPDGYPVTLRLGEAVPLELRYKIGWEETGPGEGVAHGEVRFMQAPRVDPDDDEGVSR